MSMRDHYPTGKVWREYLNGQKERHQFTGYEADPESGLNNALARWQDPELGRFLGVDPLAGKFPGWSPYNYGMNNPVMYNDPNGKEASPVYDRSGNLLGTDNQGLKGQAIVMDADRFTQNMSHEDAMKNNRSVLQVRGWIFGQPINQ